MSDKSDPAENRPLGVEQAIPLALSHQANGEFSEAELILQELLKSHPGHPVIFFQLGLNAYRMANLEGAADWLKKATDAKPDYVDAHYSLALVQKAQGHIEDAIASNQTALNWNPAHAGAHFNLATLFQSLRQTDEAMASYQKAIDHKPDYVQAHNNLGSLLVQLGDIEGAIDRYLKALSLQPDHAPAHTNLASAYELNGEREKALEHIQKSISLSPGDAEAHNNLGILLKKMGRLEDAVSSYRHALQLNPSYADAHHNLGGVLQDLARLDEASAHFKKALEFKPDHFMAWDNRLFLMLYDYEKTGEDILAEARKWEALQNPAPRQPTYTNSPEPDRVLRVGLVSGDLRRHSVSYFLESILPEFDQTRIDLFAYATSDIEDDMTSRLKKIVPHWRNVAALSDRELIQEIQRDQIDVLVDLSGHTTDNRLAVFHQKPAPVQVSWLGHNSTTGLSNIDYYVGDACLTPACDRNHYSEKPWALPDIWVCFSPPDEAIEPAPPPCLASGQVTFGSFNNLAKVSPQTIECWSQILKAVPDSRLFLKAWHLKEPSVRKITRDRFSSHGVDPDRIEMKGFSADRLGHFSEYQKIDMALDPFPYSGVTTSVEALWMGRPVLTLMGHRNSGRAGTSINKTIGLKDWIASSPQEYLDKAIAFAGAPDELGHLSSGLRTRLIESHVCDAPRFARNLERALREMWQIWCKSG